MGQGREKAYGFGLSRDLHIAFAAAYIAVLITLGGFGAWRFYNQLPAWQSLQAPSQQQQNPVAYRERPIPDPAYPHTLDNYPRVAIRNRQEGTVVVQLTILTTGEVGDVQLVKSSGFPLLDAAALVGVGDWRYLPAVRNGKPVTAEVRVALRFKLA